MTRHLADHPKPASTARLKHFLRIAREGSDRFWQGLRQRPVPVPATNRRAKEYARIERGRTV